MSTDNIRKAIGSFTYLSKDKIGRGSSSEVFKGFCQKTSEEVAIKVISLAASRKDSAFEVASTQIDLLKKFKDSSYIIQIKSAIQTKNNVYIITELCQEGSIDQNLRKIKRYGEQQAINIIEHILLGYQQMASHGIIHRDLKPSNIFQKGKQYKIGDLGYAINVEKCGHPQIQNVGSPLYMPLQTLTKNIYSFKSDIWAIGIIFIELLTGKAPWKSTTQRELAEQLKNYQIQKIIPKVISPRSKAFLARCLAKNVQQRFSIEQLSRWKFKQSSQQNKEHLISQMKLKSIFVKGQREKCLSYYQKGYNFSKKNLKIVQNNNKNELKPADGLEVNDLNKNDKISTIINKQQRNEDISTLRYIQSTARIQSNKQSIYFDIQPLLLKGQINKSVQLIKNNIIQKNRSITLYQNNFNNILSQIHSQINYIKFIFKIINKLNTSTQTSDKINNLKDHLISFIYKKIQEIKELKYIKGVNNINKKLFIKSKHYQGIQKIMGQYIQKCNRFNHSLNINAGISQRQFLCLLSYVINLIYSNIVKIVNNAQQLNRKKTLIFILEDLIQLSSIYLLQRQQHWLNFRDKNNISNYLLKSIPNNIDINYFKIIQNKFIQLTKS